MPSKQVRFIRPYKGCEPTYCSGNGVDTVLDLKRLIPSKPAQTITSNYHADEK